MHFSYDWRANNPSILVLDSDTIGVNSQIVLRQGLCSSDSAS